MLRYFLFLIVLFFNVEGVRASDEIKPSFDCAKAKTNLEELICSDAELAKLDVEMNERYKIWYSEAKDKEGVVKSQRKWLENSYVWLGKCALNLIPKWDNPENKTCVKRILNGRINFITEKINGKPVTVTENQIELGMLMAGGEFDFVQKNGLINYKDYSILPFSRKEQELVCESVESGKYEEYIYRTNLNEERINIYKEKFSKLINEKGYLKIAGLYKSSFDFGKYGSLDYSDYSGGYVLAATPLIFQVDLVETKRNSSEVFSPRTYYECHKSFVGVFYPEEVGSFKLLGLNSGYVDRIYNIECDGSQIFIIIDGKAYFVTRNKNNNITQVDRLRSVECQSPGYICDEQTFAMCKYPKGVK